MLGTLQRFSDWQLQIGNQAPRKADQFCHSREVGEKSMRTVWGKDMGRVGPSLLPGVAGPADT